MKDRDEILKMAASGNTDALAFLRAFAKRAHWLDDLRDFSEVIASDNSAKPPWFGCEQIAEEETNWLRTLLGNQFFVANQTVLLPGMLSALSAWVDAENFTPEQESVLKAQWHEVVWQVAWITGGWARMRQVCRECREFDIKEQAPEPLQPRETPDFPMGRKTAGEVCHQCGKSFAEDPWRTSLDPLGVFCSTECLRLKYPAAREEAPNGTVRT